MFDRFFLFSPTRFDNRHQSSSVVTVLSRRSETVSPLKQFPLVVISIRAPNVHATSSGRAARTHHHHHRIPFLYFERERIEARNEASFSKKKINQSFFFRHDEADFPADVPILYFFFPPLSDHITHAR